MVCANSRAWLVEKATACISKRGKLFFSIFLLHQLAEMLITEVGCKAGDILQQAQSTQHSNAQ
jgi:hypothetical protein